MAAPALKTLLLPPRFTDDSRLLGKAAERAGWSVERLSSWHIPTLLRDEDVRVYGEPLFAMHAAAELDLAMIETPYEWLAELPKKYVKRTVCNMSMAEARLTASRAFVKPAMEKMFKPAVFETGQSLPGLDAVSDAVPVIVVEPVEWEIEFRCFVRDRRCVTMSPYLIDGRIAFDEEDRWSCEGGETKAAASFIAELMNDLQVPIPPAIVIDIGQIRGRGWAIVEANPAWGSGIYGCDSTAVLQVIDRACVPHGMLQDEDRRWVIDHQSEDFR